jgi:hypothetical protein
MRVIGLVVILAVGFALAPVNAGAQHPTIPWGERPVMYLDFDSATTVLRGAFANGRPSVVMARYPQGYPDLPIMAPDGNNRASCSIRQFASS